MAGAYIIGDSNLYYMSQTQGVKGRDKNGYVDIANAVRGNMFAMGMGKDGNYYCAAGGSDIRFVGGKGINGNKKTHETNRKEHIKRIKAGNYSSIVIQSGYNDLSGMLTAKNVNNPKAVEEAKAKARAKAKEYIELALKYQKETGLPVALVQVQLDRDNNFIGWGKERYSPNIAIEEYNKELKELAEKYGLTFISTDGLVNKQSYRDRAHYSDKTAVKIVDRINEQLSSPAMVKKINAAKETMKKKKSNAKKTSQNDGRDSTKASLKNHSIAVGIRNKKEKGENDDTSWWKKFISRINIKNNYSSSEKNKSDQGRG